MKSSEICKSCGEQKEIYYGPWCSKCEVPSPENHPTLNLMQCLRHVERVYFGIEDENDYEARESAGRREIWDGLCDWGLSNDTTMHFPFVDALKGDGSLGGLSEETIVYLQALVDIFDLENHPNMLWEVSW